MSSRHAERLALIAHGMRQAPTFTEAILWQQLRGSRLGVAFRRQVVLGRFIVDFLAPARRLVVEVDGGYHAEPARARLDQRRDRQLERMGYRVVRVSAELVASDLGAAVGRVRAALDG